MGRRLETTVPKQKERIGFANLPFLSGRGTTHIDRLFTEYGALGSSSAEPSQGLQSDASGDAAFAGCLTVPPFGLMRCEKVAREDGGAKAVNRCDSCARPPLRIQRPRARSSAAPNGDH